MEECHYHYDWKGLAFFVFDGKIIMVMFLYWAALNHGPKEKCRL